MEIRYTSPVHSAVKENEKEVGIVNNSDKVARKEANVEWVNRRRQQRNLLYKRLRAKNRQNNIFRNYRTIISRFSINEQRSIATHNRTGYVKIKNDCCRKFSISSHNNENSLRKTLLCIIVLITQMMAMATNVRYMKKWRKETRNK